MYEKMIAVTNRHLVLEEPEDKAVDTGQNGVKHI